MDTVMDTVINTVTDILTAIITVTVTDMEKTVKTVNQEKGMYSDGLKRD